MKKQTQKKKQQKKQTINRSNKFKLGLVIIVFILCVLGVTTGGVYYHRNDIANWLKDEPVDDAVIVTYDGTNLFDASSADKANPVANLLGLYAYNTIELEASTNYVITTYASDEQFYDAEQAHLIVLSKQKLSDLAEDYDITKMGLDAEFNFLFVNIFPSPFKISTELYNYNYMTVMTIDDLSLDTAVLKIKVEKGTSATEYSAFGKPSTDVYDWTAQFAPADEAPPADENPIVEPTALNVGDTITNLYLNTSTDADAILRSITPDEDTGTNIIFADESGRCISLIRFDEDGQFGTFSADILILMLSEFEIIPLWLSSFDAQFVNFLESETGLTIDTTNYFQVTNTNTNLISLMDRASDIITHIGNSTDVNYDMWGGQDNFDTLFSSTPWA